MKKILLEILAVLGFLSPAIRSEAYISWNQACSFAGNSTSYVSVPNSPTLDITGSFTLEAWINPSIITGSKGIISKGGSLGTALKYGLRLSSGRILLATNGAPRLFSKSTSLLPVNEWTHVSATYDQSLNEFRIYIDGVLDTSSVVASAAPSANSDSLYIGISGNSTPFSGKLDEVRVWNRAVSSAEVARNFRSVLCTFSGEYYGLVLSIPFQREYSVSTFTTRDLSGNGNNGKSNNVSPLDLSHIPSSSICTNQAISFDGNEDYITAPDDPEIETTENMTIEFWIYPRTTLTCNLINKPGQYLVRLIGNRVTLTVNGTDVLASNIILPNERWTKVGVSFDADTVFFFSDGVRSSIHAAALGSMSSGSDSLIVGGSPGAGTDFNGMIDELRIQKRFYRSQDSALVNTYRAFDISDNDLPVTEVCYNFDGYLSDNCNDGGPQFFLRNNAKFSTPATIAGVSSAPLLRSSDESLKEGFYPPFTDLHRSIPLFGTSGNTEMQIPIYLTEPVTSIEVMVLLHHNRLSDINLYVIAPDGDSVTLMASIIPKGNDQNVRFIFSDLADSSIGTNRYASLSGYVKPKTGLMSKFAGKNPKGNWRVLAADKVSGETGIFYTAGIRINGMMRAENNLNMKLYLQGHYKPANNLQIADTVTAIIMNAQNPSIVYDSCVQVASGGGICLLSFANMPYDPIWVLKIHHRNSIETWTTNYNGMFLNYASYNMTTSASSAFGSNLIQVDTSPLAFAIYSGDVNQDRTVDATDVSLIDNDAQNFVGGYVATDLTGDDFVDGTDFAIADNNAANFVSAVLP
ncbi:MAG: proprotein convertase P-domain-containing protein [Ignavibacteria bacterium]|nr:proprotein convertase P-domain-containing protein [Ignavibacteria bacterium]